MMNKDNGRKKTGRNKFRGITGKGRWLAVILAVALAAGQPVTSVSAFAAEGTASEQEAAVSDASAAADDSMEAILSGEDAAETEDPGEEAVTGEGSGDGTEDAETGDDSEGEDRPGTEGTEGSGEEDGDGEGEGTETADPSEDPAEETPVSEDDPAKEETPETPVTPAPAAGLKTIEELKKTDADKAESTIEYHGADAEWVSERGWLADIYYVGQNDLHAFAASEKFSLKYQMEFKSSLDLDAGKVEIRVPLSLVKYKDGDKTEEVPPAKLGVPKGKPGEPVKSGTTLFNYYIDENTKEIVFFNYDRIPAGAYEAWQVLYSDIDVTKVPADSSWSFLPKVSVAAETGVQHLKEGELHAMTGTVTYKPEESKPETDPEKDDPEKTDAEAEEAEEEEEEPEESISAEELEEIDDGTAAATRETGEIKDGDGSTSHSGWSYDIYYVNQPNAHNVTKTDDFNLKYQMEFNVNVDIEKGDVRIRIPAHLFEYGHPKAGEEYTPVLPSDYGVPKGTPEKPVKARKSSFNYYEEEDEEDGVKYLVFFNYEKLKAGTKNAWQILYKNVNVMDIEDTYRWEVRPDVSVQVTTEEGKVEQTLDDNEVQKDYLAGYINTRIQLQTTTKVAYTAPGASYTPGLYTKKQVLKYAPDAASVKIPGTDELLFDHFNEYDYVVWQVRVKGYATQPYNLIFDDNTNLYNNETGQGLGDGCLFVGFGGLTPVYSGSTNNASYTAYTYSKNRQLDTSYYVVTAYPKGAVTPNYTILNNNVYARMEPFDRWDSNQYDEGHANWNYVDYNWRYRGDIIGVTKSGSPDVLNSWLTVDEMIDDDQNLSTANFSVDGTCRSYKLTHATTNGIPGYNMGDYFPGMYAQVTTVDDFVYAYPEGGEYAGATYILGPKDYFFNKVSISIKDRGYDVYEDEYALPEPVSKTEGIDRDAHIYAMFGDSETDEWELVADIPWKESGSLSYTFTAEQLAREPWRVKVVHNTVDYDSVSRINTNISIRGSSPAFKEFRESAEAVRLENIGGIMGELFYYDKTTDTHTSQDWFHDTKIQSPNYEEPGLDQNTLDLYGVIIMRDSEDVELKRESKHAYSLKAGRAYNDPEHGRATVRYRMEASEGYYVYSSEAINYLRDNGNETPHRSEVVFYDLLPYGVQFDPSGTVVAGRLRQPNTTKICSEETTWDRNQVSVAVDPATDVIQNYRGTGRTRVAFHIYYTGRDSSGFADGQWFSGFGLAFDAYCEYEDYSAAGEEPNIVAYMPGTGDSKDIIGADDEVSYDDGNVVSADGFKEHYKYLGSDINNDGKLNTHNVLYAQSDVFSDIAMATEAGIEKYVRADNDPFGTYKKSTTVIPDMGYEYKLTVTNASVEPMEDLVVFDRLENAIYDREGKEFDENKESVFKESYKDGQPDVWYGTFKKISTGEAEAMGATPVVYYNESREAVLPDEETAPSTILTAENGWIKASEWTKDLSDVKAVAVDLTAGGFELDQSESISLSIYMQAPEDLPETAVWAYNNPSFYSRQKFTGGENKGLTEGDSVKVKLKEARSLILEKEVAADTPDSRKDERFKFFLTWNDGREEQPLAYREYSLYEKNTVGEWNLQPGLHATDVDGALYLTRRQKALFTDVDAEQIRIREEDSLRWVLTDPELTGEIEDGVRIVTAENNFRPLLFVKKNVEGYAGANITEINEQEFRMKLTDKDGQPVADQEFYVVKRAMTNGNDPQIIDALHKLYGNLETPEVLPEDIRTLKTDENGIFGIYANETIAIPLNTLDEKYTVTELPECYAEDTDWSCSAPEASGKVGPNGTLLEITNNYRWKALRITKTVTGNGNTDVSETEFTFKIYEADSNAEDGKGAQVRDFEWQLLDSASAAPDPEDWQQPAEDGSITAACAGKVILVKNVETNRVFKAGKTFVVEEVLEGILAEQFINKTEDVKVKLPVYASAGDAAFVNEWQYRDIEISKTVVTADPNEDLSGKAFTMILELKEEDGDFVPAAGKEYKVCLIDGTPVTEGDPAEPVVRTTGEDGSLTIGAGQKAVFESIAKAGTDWRVREVADEDYPPLNPAIDEETLDDETQYTEYLSGKLDNVNKAEFVNGRDGILIIKKKWTAEDETSEAYLNDTMENLYTQVFVEFDGFDYPPVETIAQKDAYLYTSSYWDSQQQQYVYRTYVAMYGKDPWIILKLRDMGSSSQAYDFGSMDYLIQEAYPFYSIEGYGEYAGKTFLVNSNRDEEEFEVSSTPAETPLVEFENRLSSWNCAVQKRVMDETVPAGAELVWRVEQYLNGTWAPAADVHYSIRSLSYDNGIDQQSGQMPVPASEGTTGNDGLIHLVTTEDFYPYETYFNGNYFSSHASEACVFFDRKVYVNLNEGMKEGDFRVVEVPEESDSAWGKLALYTVSPVVTGNELSVTFMECAVSPDPKVATGFVNSPKPTYLRVEKVTSEPSDQYFTFVLQQYPYLLDDDTLVPGAQLPFTIYDAETDEELSTGVTTAQGKLNLQGGQYALIEVPHNSRWKITEEDAMPWYVEKIEVGEEEVEAEGNSAYLFFGDEDNRRKSDMLRYDFYQGIHQLMSQYGAYPDRVTKVVFGNESSYPNVISDTYSIMDSKFFGTIRAYAANNGDGTYTVYVLSKDPMYTNYSCNNMFSNFYNTNEIVFDNISTEKTTSMSNMFYRCNALNTIQGLSGFDMSNVTTTSGMFEDCSSLGSSVVSQIEGLDVSNVKDMSYMFGYAGFDSMNLNGWNISGIQNMYGMFNGASFNTLDLSGWDLAGSEVYSMDCMFSYANFNTLNLDGWDVRGKSLQNMFYYAGQSRFGEVLNINNWKWNKDTGYGSMFYYSYPSTVNANNWDMSEMEDIGNVFYGNPYYSGNAYIDTLNVENLDASNAASISLFNNSSARVINAANAKTGNVTNLENLCYYAIGLESIDLSGWDTSKVTRMSNMFYYCNVLKNFDLTGWDTSKVKYMNYMFYSCDALTDLDLSALDVSSVTDMSYMFGDCNALNNIGTTGWDTSKVIYMYNMFYNCTALTDLDLSAWNISSVRDMSSMFSGCTALETIQIDNWTCSNVTCSSMFYNCGQLSKIYCNNTWTGGSSFQMFTYCSKLSYGTGYYDYGISYAKPGTGGNFTAR